MGRSTVVLTVAAAVMAAAAAAGVSSPPLPGRPTIVGPRETASSRPVYRFRARGAVGFRCAFDSSRLHRCGARYSEPLRPGAHVLRVRAVGRSGALSRVVAVRVHVLDPVPTLAVGPEVSVGSGAGVPAVAAGAAWVPATADGSVARIEDGTVVSRTAFGPRPPEGGFLDSAIAAAGAVWVASDAGARIGRLDPATGAVTGDVPVAPRPGGLAAGGEAVWAFHFLQGVVTRIEPATAAATTLRVPNLRATGIAVAGGALWLLGTEPAQLLELDPGTGAIRRTIPLRPPFAPKRAFIETWSLAAGDGLLWATLPNHDGLARVDATTGEVRYIALRHGRPFGVAVGRGSVWVATDRAVVRLDPATGALRGASPLPLADRSGFVSIASAEGAAWVTNYDRGSLVRVTAGVTPESDRTAAAAAPTDG